MSMTNEEIGVIIGDTPIGDYVEVDANGHRIWKKEYPNYKRDAEAALRVLAWMNEQSDRTDEDYELGCRENKNWFVCQYNASFEDYKCVHRSDCFRMTDTWYGDTAPAAICAAFDAECRKMRETK